MGQALRASGNHRSGRAFAFNPTIDGVLTANGDRVLVKDQGPAFQNGIYIVGATWTRATDANTAAYLAGATVSVDQGATQAGQIYSSTFKSTDTVGTTDCTWYKVTTTQDAASGGAVTKVAEVDCGIVAKDQLLATVTDAAVLPTSKIMALQAGQAATGRTADENEMDHFAVVAMPGTGSVTFVLNALYGCLLQGNVKINYTIG